MKIRNFILAGCMVFATGMYAQDVDKATVEGNASAGQAAVDALKKVDTGESAWKFDGVVGLNAAATGLVNWAAGGNNNVNGVAFGKLHLLYHKDAIAWETNFDTEYGLSWIEQDEDAFQKSSDQIKLATKFGWEFHQDFYLTALGSFQSQYALGRNYVVGYNNIISKWLAPSYTDLALGIDYKHSYNGADFSVFVSPIAGRIATAYVSDKMNDKYSKEYMTETGETGYDLHQTLQDAYGVAYYKDGVKKYDKDFRAEFGLNIKGAIAYKYKELTLSTTLGLFTPYAGKGEKLATYEDAKTRAANFAADADYAFADHYFEYSNMNRHFGNFDVDWDVAISYQFLKVLNVTLSTSMKYYNGTLIANKDGVLAERVQFKSILGLGIGYSF